jgi:peptidyl-prolyl cis-trans isomerase D
MPFEVFRRHQRKLIAIFGIMAMFAFVVSDSLPKLLSPNAVGRDQPVVKIFGKTVYRSGLNAMLEERTRANVFISELNPYAGRAFFGGVKERDLVDALILQHEADRLGIPGGLEAGRDWLKKISGGQMTADMFEALLRRFNNRVSGQQILEDIANQVRLANVRQLLGQPLVTPYDIFRAYRDQNERVSARAIEVPVDKFLSEVPEPTEAEIQAEYDKYKDFLPDEARETPGFKVPRKIVVEILSVDGNALARGLKEALSEAELKAAYDNRKSEFLERTELPADLFAGQPELTPPITKPYEDVRNSLAVMVAEEKAQTEITDKFAKIKDEVLIPFADKYAAALDEIDEAKKEGKKPKTGLPAPTSLRDLAKREGLNYEITEPPISREEAERHGLISGAEVGLTRLSGGRKFAEEFFDPKTGKFEPEELTDLLGTRFLARKTEDIAAHVPPLDEVKKDVVLAWKRAKARPLAEKAAQALADQIKAKKVAAKDATIGGYRAFSIPAITRRQTTFMPGRFDTGAPEETPIADVEHAGEAFRNAYFGLKPGDVAVAANEPRTSYYVLVPEQREPATFAALYNAANSDEFRYRTTAQREAARELDEEWLGWLRKKAGITADWVPPDESKNKSDSEGT